MAARSKGPKRRVSRVSTISGNNIVTGINTVFRSSIDIDAFLAIEDEELKRYIFNEGFVSGRGYIKKVDNEEKVGYYYVSCDVKRNRNNQFYKQSVLNAWIVYKKDTKKMSVSTTISAVSSLFFQDYLKPEAISIAKRFIKKLTPTLCKKIIEGKIVTLGDLISYNKSYVIRRKALSLQAAFRFMITGKEYSLTDIENPEDLESLDQLEGLVTGGTITYRLGDTDTKERYNEWRKKQGEKYDTFLRSTNGEAGNTVSETAEY